MPRYVLTGIRKVNGRERKFKCTETADSPEEAEEQLQETVEEADGEFIVEGRRPA